MAMQKGEAERMIRRCDESDFDLIWEIVNEAAQAYKGIIPSDRWHEPYMSRDELRHEIDAGVTGAMMGGVLSASAILKRNLLSVITKGAGRSPGHARIHPAFAAAK